MYKKEINDLMDEWDEADDILKKAIGYQKIESDLYGQFDLVGIDLAEEVEKYISRLKRKLSENLEDD